MNGGAVMEIILTIILAYMLGFIVLRKKASKFEKVTALIMFVMVVSVLAEKFGL